MRQQLIIAMILWSAIGAAGLLLAFAVEWVVGPRRSQGLRFIASAFERLPRHLRVPAIRFLGAVLTLGAFFGIFYNLAQYREIRRRRTDVETLRVGMERDRIKAEIDTRMNTASDLWRRKRRDESIQSAEDALRLAEEKFGTDDEVTVETRQKVEKARAKARR